MKRILALVFFTSGVPEYQLTGIQGYRYFNGDPSFPLYERFYPIDNKAFSLKDAARISSGVAELYGKGWSLRDIARELGRSKTTVRSCLMKEGLELREVYARATHDRKLSGGKQGALPYYGFCYFEGEIVPDPREFPILKIIHRNWRAGVTVHTTTKELNRRRMPSRLGREWSWAAVNNIVNRFSAGQVVLKGSNRWEFS